MYIKLWKGTYRKATSLKIQVCKSQPREFLWISDCFIKNNVNRYYKADLCSDKNDRKRYRSIKNMLTKMPVAYLPRENKSELITDYFIFYFSFKDHTLEYFIKKFIIMHCDCDCLTLRLRLRLSLLNLHYFYLVSDLWMISSFTFSWGWVMMHCDCFQTFTTIFCWALNRRTSIMNEITNMHASKLLPT